MAASMDDESDLIEADDYYAWLGLSKEATDDEINNAFRNMSRLYHPDKHANRPEMIEKATALFTKIKKAHEVLSDPQKRAIYDAVGVKGLEVSGMEVVPRSRNPQEIIEEYERIKKSQEELREWKSMNSKGSIAMGVNATDIFDGYYDEDEATFAFPDVEMSELSMFQVVECPLTSRDTVLVSGTLSSIRGSAGIGKLHVAFRRLLSFMGWAEVDVGLGNGVSCDVRGYKTLFTNGFGTMAGSLQITKKGRILVACSTAMGLQLDKNLQSRMSLDVGLKRSSMNCTLVWNPSEHNIQTSFTLGVPMSEARLIYSYHIKSLETNIRTMASIGTTGLGFEYECNRQITKHSNLGMRIHVGTATGVTLRIRLRRGTQTFLFPVHLSAEICPQAVFYGTVIPLAVYFGVKVLIVQPFIKEKENEQLKKKKEANAFQMEEKRREAQSEMELMQDLIARSYEREEEKGGLVIRKALFGKLQGDELSELECITVSRQLQAMVKDSKLVIPSGTKLSELSGFYDPCIGESKHLFMTYDFRRQSHSAHFEEGDKILIPDRRHLLNSPSEGD